MKRFAAPRRYPHRRFRLPPLLVLMIGLVFIFANPVATIASVSNRAGVADQRAQATEDPNAVSTEDPNAVSTEDPNAAPTEPGFSTGTLNLNAFDCGNSFDDPNSISSNNLFTSCLAPASVSFDVMDSQGTSQSGTGSFSVAAGQVDVTQSQLDGYQQPYIACDDSTFTQVSNWAASVQVPADGALTCTFFNLAIPPTDLVIHKWTCPDAYDWQAQGADPSSDCTQATDGVTFMADGPNGYHSQTNTGDSVPGSVMFGGLAAGSYTITETLPDGVDSAFLWNCVYEGTLSEIPSQPMNQGNTAQLDLFRGGALTCDWFNVPAHNGNSVTVYKWLCPEGMDYGQAPDYYSAACDQEHLNIPITLTDDSGDHATTTQANGTQWDDVVVEQSGLTITEEIPSGFGDPVVFCAPLDQDSPTQVDSTGGVIHPTAFGADTPWSLQCFWYNIPTSTSTPTTTDGNSVTVYKWQCPAGTSSTGGAPDYYSAACDTQMTGIPITLTDDNGDHATTTQSDGTSWDNVVVDQSGLTITEEIPSGYGDPVVYCAPLDQDSPTQVDSTGGVIHPSDFGADTPWSLQCFWYNIPTTTSTPTTGNTVTVYKYDCPASVGHSLTGDEYQAQCTQEMTGIPFTLIDDRGNNDATSQAGGTTWSDVQPSGGLTISESVPAGYENPEVFCQLNGTGNWEQQDAHNEAVSPETGSWSAPWTWVCRWYNIPEYNGTPTTLSVDNSVTVYKWLCPEGTAYGLTLEEYGAACDQEHLNIPITLTDANGAHATTTQANGTNWEQVIPIVGINGNLVQVNEDIPSGFGNPVVFCAPLDVDTTTQVSSGGGGIIIQDFGADSPWTVQCNWYNIPLVPGTVTVIVNKHQCPDGYQIAGKTEYDLAAECHDTPNPIDFTVAASGGYSTTKTVQPAPDYGSWDDVPSGSVTVTENIPDGFGQPVVYCKVEDVLANDLVSTYKASVTNGAISAPLGDQQVFWCDWFNVPSSKYGTITIYKWNCPEGTVLDQEDTWYGSNCTQAMSSVPFTLQTATGDQPSSTDGSGMVTWTDVPLGDWAVQETIPDGYGQPVVICSFTAYYNNAIYDGFPSRWNSDGGLISGNHDIPGYQIVCNWYNIPGGYSTVTIYKYGCPEGTTYDHDYDWYSQNCTQGMKDIPFRLWTSDYGTSDKSTDGSGTVIWDNLPVGGWGVQETIPENYGQPVVYCYSYPAYGQEEKVVPQQWESTNGYVSNPGDTTHEARKYFCYWYNVPAGPGEVTIYKYWCDEGYDYNAYGADPYNDCKKKANGITFTADGPDSYHAQTNTGDSVDSAVYFGGLKPGDYTFKESVPQNTKNVFVLDCYGQWQGQLRPYPLSVGDTLKVSVHAGESVTCYWYNVPRTPKGKITVYKYMCSTKAYVSDVDCEIYEGGATFDLVMWNGSNWVKVDTKTTNPGGMITWGGIDPGQYWLDEHDQDWCRMTSPEISADGNWINVYDGKETAINVYNCGGKPGTPGKTPTKYPNTGVPPQQGGPGSPTSLPGAALVGFLGLGLNRRKLVGLLGLGGAGVLAREVVAQGTQTIEPTGGTPSAGGTPASLCLVSTPTDATPEGGGDCFRGAVPATLKVDAIGVDAPVEILETVDGVMQQPSDENHVAWYKETARLGETGNVLIAGHLNWWGVPEAVFYNLGVLKAGDDITVLDEAGTEFHFVVEWVRQESNLEAPAEDVLGMTSYQAVTLMTCGGQWDSSISEYNERTVARARRAVAEATT